MKILIKSHVEGLILPNKIEQGDWIDLRAAEDIFIPFMEMELVSLGISMKLPEGYEAHLAPRSSTFKNFGIVMTNSFGVIDNSYCGDNDIWKVPVMCLNPHGSYIKKNDRICQFRIVKKQPAIEFEEVEFLSDKSRGGFGSTGTN